MTATRFKQEGLIEWLHSQARTKERGIAKARAILATLRRGLLLEPAQFFQLFAVIPPQFLQTSREELERRLMVAILFASHSEHLFSDEQLDARSRNLGESLRNLAEKASDPNQPPEDLLTEPLKRRMDAVLAAPADEVYDHLRHLTSLLRAKEVPVDWGQLLRDLRRWSESDRPVQWWWSRSFYVGYRERQEEE